jgi:hypothetical protein
MARRSRSGLLAATALATLASCGDGAPFVGYVSRSDFYEYHDQVDEPLCPSLMSLLDQHARLVGGEIGLGDASARPFRYYKFSDAQALYASYEAGGKAFGDYLVSSDYFQPHEQAHLYTFRTWGGWSTNWLNEGEAVALSCEPTSDPIPSTTPRALLMPSDWRDQLYGALFTPEGYAAAGFLVTHLAQTYGWEQIGRLHRRVPPAASQADLERAFAEVFPISMDQAWSEALDSPGAPACDRAWICLATPLALGVSTPPACDGRLHSSVTVADGDAGLVLDVADDTGITLSARCADAGAPWYPLPGTAGGMPATHWALVPPGPYTLFAGASELYVPPAGPAAVSDGEFTPRAKAPTAVTLRAHLTAGLVGGACASAGTISLEAAGTTYLDLVRGYDDAWIQIDGRGGTFGAAAINLIGIGAVTEPLALCDGCGPSATCTPLPVSAITISTGTVLHIQSAYPDRPPAAGQIAFYPAPAAN